MSATYANTILKVTANMPDSEVTAKYHLHCTEINPSEQAVIIIVTVIVIVTAIILISVLIRIIY